MFKRILRRASTSPFSVGKPAEYTLTSIRTFPSLEPHTMKAYPSKFLDQPLRRDLLWSAVVYEADCARVGSGYVPTKADSPFSNRKIRPQKGGGVARVGDANSPIRDNGLKAHGIKAPHDWSTKLPTKVYKKAFRTALSDQYRRGRLFVIGGDIAPEHDSTQTDFKYSYPEQMRQFIEHHNYAKLNLLFIVDGPREQLLNASADMGKKCDVIVKDAVEVRDILRANQIFVEEAALNWFVSRYGDQYSP